MTFIHAVSQGLGDTVSTQLLDDTFSFCKKNMFFLDQKLGDNFFPISPVRDQVDGDSIPAQSLNKISC